jgi:hypothetical protein
MSPVGILLSRILLGAVTIAEVAVALFAASRGDWSGAIAMGLMAWFTGYAALVGLSPQADPPQERPARRRRRRR